MFRKRQGGGITMELSHRVILILVSVACFKIVLVPMIREFNSLFKNFIHYRKFKGTCLAIRNYKKYYEGIDNNSIHRHNDICADYKYYSKGEEQFGASMNGRLTSPKRGSVYTIYAYPEKSRTVYTVATYFMKALELLALFLIIVSVISFIFINLGCALHI